MSARPTFELAEATSTEDGLTSGDARAFAYEHPFVDVSSSTRTAEHEPIDEDPVVQSLGPKVREITIEGHCYLPEANYIDGLAPGGLVHVVTDRWSGYAVVSRADTRATGEGGGKQGTMADRIYDYMLELLEITDNRPASVGALE